MAFSEKWSPLLYMFHGVVHLKGVMVRMLHALRHKAGKNGRHIGAASTKCTIMHAMDTKDSYSPAVWPRCYAVAGMAAATLHPYSPQARTTSYSAVCMKAEAGPCVLMQPWCLLYCSQPDLAATPMCSSQLCPCNRALLMV